MGDITGQWPETWYEVRKGHPDTVTAVECDRCTESAAWIASYRWDGERCVHRKNRVTDWKLLFRTFKEVQTYLKQRLEASVARRKQQLETLPEEIRHYEKLLADVDTMPPPQLEKK